MKDLLVLREVSRYFGGVRAVDGCSFAVREGSFVGLIGPNGAGKSTVFNLVSGLLHPDQGEIVFKGENLAGHSPEQIARLGIGRTFQTPREFRSLDLLENMLASVQSSGEGILTAVAGRYHDEEARAVRKCLELLDFVGLGDRANEDCSALSGGELRMLEVARQLVREPEVLLLDEPTAGVDPRLQGRLASLLRRISEQRRTLVVVEHNLSFLLALADHVVVMANGSVLMQGTPEEVRQDSRVIEAYLGRGHAA